MTAALTSSSGGDLRGGSRGSCPGSHWTRSGSAASPQCGAQPGVRPSGPGVVSRAVALPRSRFNMLGGGTAGASGSGGGDGCC
eukprot:scaffold92457_cov61-Phaeocystis_antarctica.AAC.4